MAMHPLLPALKSLLAAPNDDATHDELLSSLLDAAQAKGEDKTGLQLTLDATAITEIYTGDGSQRLVLQRAPLVSLNSDTDTPPGLVINGVTIAQSTAYNMEGWYIQNGILKLRGTGRFFSGDSSIYATNVLAGTGSGVIETNSYNGNISVTYKAGFATIPADIARALVKMAAVAFAEKTHLGKKSIHMGQETTSFQETWITPDVKEIFSCNARRVF